MIKLKRLAIKRYRNVEPCELVFSDRLNVVIGPNGSGKTTLLDLVAWILRTDLSDARDPFSIDVDLTFSGSLLSGHIESLPDLRVGQSKPRPEFRGAPLKAVQEAQPPLFELTLSHPERLRLCTITRTDDRVPRAHPRDPESFDIEPFFPTTPPWSLLYEVFARANQVMYHVKAPNTLVNVTRFDESFGASQHIVAPAEDVNLADAGLRARFNVWRAAGSPVAVPIEWMAPPGITELIAQSFDEGMPFVAFDGSELRFLSIACRLFKMRAATVRLDVVKQTKSPSGFEVSELGNLQFWFTRHDGSVVRDLHLSFGQKRLLSFLYFVDANPDIVVADEPAAGLHPIWALECMVALRGRQSFLATQSPVILDNLAFASPEDVQSTFIVCRTVMVGESEKMVWRNLTDDEAAMVYRAHETGMETVGEILRTRGLW